MALPTRFANGMAISCQQRHLGLLLYTHGVQAEGIYEDLPPPQFYPQAIRRSRRPSTTSSASLPRAMARSWHANRRRVNEFGRIS